MCDYVCVCVSSWLCVHSTVNWSGCSVDWMEKGSGARSASLCISRWESPLCCHHIAFLLTGHAQWATPHIYAPPPSPSTFPPPASTRGLFEPVTLRFLIWPSKPGAGTVGCQGREEGGLFFPSKSSLGNRADMSLIISTLCFLPCQGSMQQPTACMLSHSLETSECLVIRADLPQSVTVRVLLTSGCVIIKQAATGKHSYSVKNTIASSILYQHNKQVTKVKHQNLFNVFLLR